MKILVAAVALTAVAVVVFGLIHLRTAALDWAETRARQSALLFEQHTIRTLRATSFVLDNTAALAEAADPSTLGGTDTWHRLKQLAAGLPEQGEVSIVGADGWLIAGTTAHPINPTNVTDRAYFKAHKEDRATWFVGPLVRLKHYDRNVFHVSRRLEDAKGSFTGVVVASVDAAHFIDFQATLALGPRSTLTLYRTDGSVVMHQPEPKEWGNTSIANTPLLAEITAAPHGVIRSVAPLDGVERLLSWRAMPEWGLIVAVGVSTDDALESWWTDLWATLGILAGIGAILGTLAAFAFRSLAREEAMMAGLEAAVEERTEEAKRNAGEAQAANNSKSRFLAAASHDLRQPLQAAGMFVEVLATRLVGSPHVPILDKLRQALESTQSLLTMLLDVSTLEAGRVKPTYAIFPLAPLLAGLVNQMELEATARNLKLKVVPTSAWVQSDPVLLERILRNLLVNALRYTETGGVVIGCRRRGNGVSIQVTDTGTGIPADKLDIVFDDFTRLNDKGGGSGGLGLGLGVVRRTARLLGHPIELKSQPGKGSSFRVVVPRVSVRPRI